MSIFCFPVVHYPDLSEIKRKHFIAILSLLEVSTAGSLLISLLFSQCLGKTLQFPRSQIFEGIFFRSMNLCSVIGEEETEMLCFHDNVKRIIFFFFHFDSPEISQANLIV